MFQIQKYLEEQKIFFKKQNLKKIGVNVSLNPQKQQNLIFLLKSFAQEKHIYNWYESLTQKLKNQKILQKVLQLSKNVNNIRQKHISLLKQRLDFPNCINENIIKLYYDKKFKQIQLQLSYTVGLYAEQITKKIYIFLVQQFIQNKLKIQSSVLDKIIQICIRQDWVQLQKIMKDLEDGQEICNLIIQFIEYIEYRPKFDNNKQDIIKKSISCNLDCLDEIKLDKIYSSNQLIKVNQFYLLVLVNEQKFSQKNMIIRIKNYLQIKPQSMSRKKKYLLFKFVLDQNQKEYTLEYKGKKPILKSVQNIYRIKDIFFQLEVFQNEFNGQIMKMNVIEEILILSTFIQEQQIYHGFMQYLSKRLQNEEEITTNIGKFQMTSNFNQIKGQVIKKIENYNYFVYTICFLLKKQLSFGSYKQKKNNLYIIMSQICTKYKPKIHQSNLLIKYQINAIKRIIVFIYFNKSLHNKALLRSMSFLFTKLYQIDTSKFVDLAIKYLNINEIKKYVLDGIQPFDKILQNLKPENARQVFLKLKWIQEDIQKHNDKRYKLLKKLINFFQRVPSQIKLQQNDSLSEIEKVFCQLNKINFQIQTDNDFRQLYIQLSRLQQTKIVKIFLKKDIKKKFSNFLSKSVTQYKTKNTLELLNMTYIISPLNIINQENLESLLSIFFIKKSVNYNTQICWDNQQHEAWSKQIIIYFIENIFLYYLFQKRSNKKTYDMIINNIIKIELNIVLHSLQIAYHEFFKCQQFLKKQQFKTALKNIFESYDNNTKRNFMQLLPNKLQYLIEMSEQMRQFFYKQMIEYYRRFVNNSLIKLTLKIMNYLIRNVNVNLKIKKEFIFELFYLNNKQINTNIIECLLFDLNCIDLIIVSIDKNQKVKEQIIQNIKIMYTNIRDKHIKYQYLIKISQFSKEHSQKFNTVFKVVIGQEKMTDILLKYLKQYNLTKQQNFLKSSIIKKFDFQKIFNEIASTLDTNNFKFISNQMYMNQYIQKVNKIQFNPLLYQIFNFKCYKPNIEINMKYQFQRFVDILNNSVVLFRNKIKQFIQKYEKKSIKIDQFDQLIDGLNDQQIYELFKLVNDQKQDVNKIINLAKQIRCFKKYTNLYYLILDIFKITNYQQNYFQNTQSMIILFQKYKLNKLNDIQVSSFYQIIQKFKAQISKYQQVTHQNINIFFDYAQFLHFTQQVWLLFQNISVEKIQFLKQYLDQNQQYENLNSNDISDLEFVNDFYHAIKKSKNLCEFFKLLLMTNKNKIESNLETVKKNLNNFSEKIKLDLNLQDSIKYKINSIMKKSDIIIKQQTNEIIFQIKLQNGLILQYDQLIELKHKVLLMIHNDKKIHNQSDKLLMQEFIQLIKKLEHIIIQLKKLKNLGYLDNFLRKQNKKQFVIEKNVIQNEFMNEISNFLVLISQFSTKWKDIIQQGYENYFGLCHFQGIALKNMVLDLIKKQYGSLYKITQFKQLSNNNEEKFNLSFNKFYQNTVVHQDEEDNIKQKYNIPERKFNYLTKFFAEFEKKKKIYIIDKILISLITSEENKFFSSILVEQIQVLNKINLPQILICKTQTTKQQIQLFLLRSLLDPQLERPYFLIGTHFLTIQVQNYFINKFEEYVIQNKKLQKNNKFNSLKLIIIDNSYKQKIYIYFKNCHEFKPKRIQFKNFQLKNKQQFFLKNAVNKIVSSKICGMGKTFYILEDIKKQKLNAHFFPVAGNITISNLFKRLKKLKLNDKSALIIQIHYITQRKKKVLDEFLFQILIFRCIYDQGYLFLPKSIKIYVQLQNTGQDHFQGCQTLTLFQNNQQYLINLKSITKQNFNINYSDLQFMFVMKYLSLIKNQKINTQELNCKQEFKKLQKQQIFQLIQQYFLQPMKQKRNNPSFRQLKYFIQLLYKYFINFSNSQYFRLNQIIEYEKEMPQKNFFKNLRLNFLKLIINNARQFITKSVSQRQFQFFKSNQKYNTSFNQKLQKFDFLIINNHDSESFQFIYKNYEKVDAIVKMLILQQTNQIKVINLKNLNKQINQSFQLNSFKNTRQNILQINEKLPKILKNILGFREDHIFQKDPNYQLTLDNFFKICLILQRCHAQLPIIIMGQTGIGKTALIRYLVQKILKQKLIIFNIHSGFDEIRMIRQIEKLRKIYESNKQKRTWVFFDEFNTTEQLGYIKQIILERRFLGEELPSSLIFIAACNPYRKFNQNYQNVGLINKNRKLIYKVLQPPESILEVLWNYQQLNFEQNYLYIKTMLINIEYPKQNLQKIFKTLHKLHEKYKKQIEISSINLRDVAKFKILYSWFLQNSPNAPVPVELRIKNEDVDYQKNYQISNYQRSFILAIYFCYIMKLSKEQFKKEFCKIIQEQMNFQKDQIMKVVNNQQTDYVSRMKIKSDIAINNALKQNIFSTFVAIMNNLPILIVGRPGCSKSLALNLMFNNLRGKDSQNQFFRKINSLKIFVLQCSQNTTSQSIEKVYQKAQKFELKYPNRKICIIFDQIGLAQRSIYNPLKVLHSKLELKQTKFAIIGISNYELDASKMGRFIIVNRHVADKNQILQTTKILIKKSVLSQSQIKGLSQAYAKFISQLNQESQTYQDFFGMRDYYYLLFNLNNNLKQTKTRFDNYISIKRAIQRNFNGRIDSAIKFMTKLCDSLKQPELFIFNRVETPVLELIKQNLQNRKNSRYLLLIIKGQTLLNLINKEIKIQDREVINIHGSTFQYDRSNQEYNLNVVCEIMNYVSSGKILVLKDLPNAVNTSLYNLFNKSYMVNGKKEQCIISVGINTSKYEVHQNFNCVIYIKQDRLREIDSPFLNRFQKHYLTLQKLLKQYEIQIRRKIFKWLNDLFQQIINKQNPLKKQHYLINVNQQSLDTLILSQTFKVGQNKTKQNMINIINNIKRILLLTSTTDFHILTQLSKNLQIKQLNLINGFLDQKKNLQKQLKCLDKLMVYTYDQEVIRIKQNILYQKSVINSGKKQSIIQKTKIIKILEINSQKSLRIQIKDFYENQNYQVCHLKMNFQKEYFHLNLVLCLLDHYEKKYKISQNNKRKKRIYIILMISRLTLFTIEKYSSISYINDYMHIFLESLKEDSLKIQNLPNNISEIILNHNQIIKVQEIIKNKLTEVLQRFQFYHYFDKSDNFRNKFEKFIENLNTNDNFIQYSKKFIVRFLKQSQQNDNWKKKILVNRQNILSCFTTIDAFNYQLEKTIQDCLSIFIKLVVQKQIIYCFDLKNTLQFFELYITQSKLEMSKIKQNFKKFQSYFDICKKYLNEFVENYVYDKSHEIKRSKNSSVLMISFPKFYPFSTQDLIYLSKRQKNLANQQMKSVEQICQKIKDLQIKLQYPNNQQKYLKSQIEQYQQQIYDNLKKCFSFQINKNVDLIRLYLIDIKIQYFKNSLGIQIIYLLDISQVVKNFSINQNQCLFDEITNIFKGSVLWKKIIPIIKVLKKIRKRNNESYLLYFLKKFQKKIIEKSKECQNQLSFYSKQIIFVSQILDLCQQLFQLNEDTHGLFTTQERYEQMFNNVYYAFQQLCRYYTRIPNNNKIRKQIPKSLRVIKNFVKLLNLVYNNKKQNIPSLLFIDIFAVKTGKSEGSLYKKIKQFLNDQCKQNQSQINYFEALYLYNYWIKQIYDSKKLYQVQAQYFIDNLITSINSKAEFAQLSCFTLYQIFSRLNLINISQLIQNLSNNNIRQNLILIKLIQALENNSKSNLHILLSDFFYKYLNKSQVSQEQILFNQYAFFETYISHTGLNHLQTIAFMGFLRYYIYFYIKCLEKYKDPNLLDRQLDRLMIRIDQKLSDNNGRFSSSIKIYALKLLRRNYKSTMKLKNDYINIRVMNWLSEMENKFTQNNIQLNLMKIPKTKREKINNNLFNQFKEVKTKDRLIKLIRLNNIQQKYELLSFFLEQVYTFKQNQATRNNITQYLKQIKKQLKQNQRNVLIELQILIKYSEGYVTKQLNSEIKKFNQNLNDHFILLNILNLIISTRFKSSPLTQFFFTQNGQIPINFSDHIQNKIMISGQDNPFLLQMRKIKQNIFQGFYVCSNQCDYIYQVEDKGWPIKLTNCLYCGQLIGISNGKLVRTDQGARRIGPNLLFSKQKFQEEYIVDNMKQQYFYIWNLLKQKRYWRLLQNQLQCQKEKVTSKTKVRILKQNKLKQIILTGYSNSNIKRMNPISIAIFKFMIHTIFYFFISFDWINQKQCKKIFMKQKNQALKQILQIIQQNKINIYKSLNSNNNKQILLTLQNEIFEYSKIFSQISKNQQQFKQRKEKQLLQHLQLQKNIQEISKQKQPTILFNKLIQNSLTQKRKSLELDKKNKVQYQNLTTLFQQQVQKSIILPYFQQNLIQNLQFQYSQKKVQTYVIDKFLLEQEQTNLQYPYLNLLPIRNAPSLDHIDTNKIKQKYPLLNSFIQNLNKLQEIYHLYNIIAFCNNLHNYVNDRYQQKECQKINISQYWKKQYPSENEIEKRLIEKKLSQFLQSISYLKKNNKYEFLRQINKQANIMTLLLYEIKQKSKIYIIYENFSILQNELIDQFEKRINLLTKFKNIQFFPKNKFSSQQISQFDVFRITRKQLEKYTKSFSYFQLTYGKRQPLYLYQNIEYALSTMIFDKKRIEDTKYIINVKFVGQQSRFRKINYMIEAKNLFQYIIEIQKQEQIKRKLEKIKYLQNNKPFYKNVKQIQQFLEKIFKYTKSNPQFNLEISQYIKTNNINNEIKNIFYDIQLAREQISTTLFIYQELEILIFNEVWDILSNRYKQERFSRFEKNKINQLIQEIKYSENYEYPKFIECKYAIYRLVSRTFIYNEVSPQENLTEYLLTRTDCWPKLVTMEQIIKLITELDNIGQFKLSKLGHLYQILQERADDYSFRSESKIFNAEIPAQL